MGLSPSSSQNVEVVIHTIVLQDDFEELSRLSAWINQLAEQLQISANGAFRLDLALTETVTNIIEHAYQGSKEHQITITLLHQQNEVKIRVEDDGRPFDPLQQPEATLPSRLEDVEAGGLGIHLIRNYTDECYYRRDGDRNLLTLVFNKKLT